MPKGYVIASVTVTDPVAWERYAAKAKDAFTKYGGKPVVRGGRVELIEGAGRARNVVLEFESFDQARAYVHSPEYAEAKKERTAAGLMNMVVVEG